jgi:hypothetical protein
MPTEAPTEAPVEPSTSPTIPPQTSTKFFKNSVEIFYDKNTLGINIYENPCKKVTGREFREYIKQNVKCENDLCFGNNYNCDYPGHTNCFHVEYIIDVIGPEFSCTECKKIAANIVLINGQWKKN